MTLCIFLALALSLTRAVLSQQCAEPTSGAQSPSSDYPIYISPNETCEFVLNVALFGGNCTPALNIATIAGPSPYNTRTATVTLTVGVSVGVPFATDIPAGQLPEGNYIINNELHFDGPPLDLGSIVIITHEPIIVNTDATSTLTVSSTQFVTRTVTVTGGEVLTRTGIDTLDVDTPAMALATTSSETSSALATTAFPMTTITTTVTPKAVTKIVSVSVTRTSTASCLPITADPPAPSPTPTTLARMKKREQPEVYEPKLRKRDLCSSLGPQPTVTMYTSTIISTVTSPVTETETVTETQFNSGTVTFFTEPGILKRAAVTDSPITKYRTVHTSRPTLTSTSVITIVVMDKGVAVTNCAA